MLKKSEADRAAFKDTTLDMITPDLQHAISYYISGTAYNDLQQAGSQTLSQTHLNLYTAKIQAIMSRDSTAESSASHSTFYNPMGVNYNV